MTHQIPAVAGPAANPATRACAALVGFSLLLLVGSLGALWLTGAAGFGVLLAVGAAQALALVCSGALVAWRAERRFRRWLADRTSEGEDYRHLRDPETGLPGPAALEDDLTRMLALASRRGTDAALIQIELSGFDALRQSLGRKAGTEILRLAGERLRRTLRTEDVAGHLGHGTFLVGATELATHADMAALTRRLRETLVQPFAIDDVPQRLECRMGVALLSDEPASTRPGPEGRMLPALPDVERLMGNAELALCHASHVADGVRYYGHSLRCEADRRDALMRDLRRGLERGEVVPFFQPQVSLATGALVGFEALARWQHPEQGLLPPPVWLEIAERGGLIDRLGEVMLEAVLEVLAGWDAAGVAVPVVGVNFALSQLRNPGLIDRIKWAVDRRALQPKRLSIEVLETVLVRGDADLVLRNLNGLAATGFRVELDDFGTGHTSIANVRRFQAERIKIDRSFVRGIDASLEQHKLVASIVGMAQALGIRTIAEGVEHAAEEAALRSMGCDEMQGFRIARPMDATSATAWLSGAGNLRERPPLRLLGTRQ